MRKAPNKTVGYVVIPLFLDEKKAKALKRR